MCVQNLMLKVNHVCLSFIYVQTAMASMLTDIASQAHVKDPAYILDIHVRTSRLTHRQLNTRTHKPIRISLHTVMDNS